LSILTKICVVVLAVLILLGCPIFITQATVGPSFRQALKIEQARSNLHRLDAIAEKNAHNNTMAQRDKALADLSRLRDEKKAEMDKLAEELATARNSAASLQNNLAVLAAKVGGLEKEAATFNQRNDLLAAQLERVRKSNDELNKENIKLSELLQQTEVEKDRTDKLARLHQETIRELEEEIENLRKFGPSGQPGSEEIIPASGREIIGTVTEVKEGIASINVGSAKGVQRNMQLVIYRGHTLVGFLRVEEVDVDEAAGIIVNRQLEPMQGDKVTTRVLE